MARILVVDDEPQIRRALRAALAAQAHDVVVAESGEAALDLISLGPCDLVILDLGLADMDGAEVCARLREWTQVPVIVLSVRDDERSKVVALDRGADDYLVKPFGVAELLARVRAHLRRAREEVAPPRIQCGGLTIDLVRRRLEVDGVEVRLTRKEFDLLSYLAANRGRVLTHRMLLQHVWGPEYGSEVQYLRVFVSQLRRKLEPDPHMPRYVLTDVGVGYRFPDAD